MELFYSLLIKRTKLWDRDTHACLVPFPLDLCDKLTVSCYELFNILTLSQLSLSHTVKLLGKRIGIYAKNKTPKPQDSFTL